MGAHAKGHLRHRHALITPFENEHFLTRETGVKGDPVLEIRAQSLVIFCSIMQIIEFAYVRAI